MATPIPLRTDFDGPGLRRLARETKDANQARRLLALAAIYEGGTRTDAARFREAVRTIEARIIPIQQRIALKAGGVVAATAMAIPAISS